MADAAFLTQATSAYQSAQLPPKIGKISTAEEARKVALEFESFFLSQALQLMFASIDTEPPFGGGHAEKVWQGMLVEQYGKSMAEAGGIGIADAIQAEILRAQESAQQRQAQELLAQQQQKAPQEQPSQLEPTP